MTTITVKAQQHDGTMTDEEKSKTRMVWVKSLIRFGHSADKALEIAIDCERGDKHAKLWIKHVNENNMKKMMKVK
tara:strand:- start:353 stop:577 length:225 start_codon:yes stop_codon:yes gene_type:complete